jgi:hypothetical protein
MLSLVYLVLCFGIGFGLQNKVPFLYGKSKFVDDMLACSYCTGFHAGWISWLITRPIEGLGDGWYVAPFVWGFASAATCYTLDVATQLMEKASSK